MRTPTHHCTRDTCGGCDDLIVQRETDRRDPERDPYGWMADLAADAYEREIGRSA